MKSALLHSLLALFFCLAPVSGVQAETVTDLTDLPLESLLELRVTSVSKKSQLLTEAAAAIFVITQDDIRRSGATNIPDLLRMVPGVQVARIDSSKWAISSRGHNGRYSNKLLVLQDGRSLYTPLFAGVYWEVQDTVLEDIARIEVIRGPGAALWGANAVNGVINIITKSAENTRGGLVSAGGGTSERGFGTVRYGMNVGDNTFLRLYVKHLQRDNGLDAAGNDTHDAWHMTRGGFRLDSKPTYRDTLTLQGEYYDGGMQETYKLFSFPVPPDTAFSRLVDTETAVSGGNILTRWQRDLSGSDSLSLQVYYDHNQRNMFVLPQKLDTLDLDFQHRFSTFAAQDIVWGLGYRFGHYDVSNSPTLSFLKQQESNHLFSAFVHDEITLISEKLSLILGSRFERNDYTGFEIQPNGRILWTPAPGHTFWGAVSRAVRTATRGEQDIQYHYRALSATDPLNTIGFPLRLEIVGSPDFKSEELLAYEIGYRVEPAARLSVDVALYYNVYKHLRVVKPGAVSVEAQPTGSSNVVQQFILSNDMHGTAYGAEISADWLPCPWWRLQVAYSYERLTMHLDGASTDAINKGNAEGDTPRHQASLRSGIDLGRQVTLDLWLRGTDYLASIDGVSIPGYLTMDARLAWKPLHNLELALVGQNLFDHRHPEFIPEYINSIPSEVVRSVYGKLTWKF